MFSQQFALLVEHITPCAIYIYIYINSLCNIYIYIYIYIAQEITCLVVQYLKYSTVGAFEEMTNHSQTTTSSYMYIVFIPSIVSMVLVSGRPAAYKSNLVAWYYTYLAIKYTNLNCH